MKFSESEILLREEKLSSSHHRLITRLRLDVLYVFTLAVIGLFFLMISFLGNQIQDIIKSAPATESKDILYSSKISYLYDQEGNEYRTLDAGKDVKRYVMIEDISKAAQDAFVAAADTGFYKHQGINLRGVLGTMYGDEKSSAVLQRTLTQQLIRNQIFLNEDRHSMKSRLVQNIQEQYLAAEMEAAVGKEKILEYYLNTLYFGGDRVGIKSASQYYFDKEPSELTASEASMLAAVSQDPDAYDPLSQQLDNTSLRKSILEEMLEMEFLSEDEYEDALGDNVYLSVRTVQDEMRKADEHQNDYSTAAIAQVISDLKKESGYSATQAYNAVYHGGLKIYTCLDSIVQDVCEEEIAKQFEKRKDIKKEQMSFVLLDQSTGMVKALVGISGKEGYADGNIATALEREPGEVLPILSVWLPAIDTGGETLGSVEDDSIYNYDTKASGQEITNPVAQHQGIVTMRQSLLQQLESPSIKTLEKINPQTGFDYLKKLGITTLVDGQKDLDGNIVTDVDLTLACGNLVRGVTNLELTNAFATIANNGKHVDSRFYTKVIDGDGKVLLQSKGNETQVLKRSSTWLLTDVLKEYAGQEKGSTINSADTVISAAGIGGNSKLAADVWFEGFTPDYTAGLWCGNTETTGPLKSLPAQKIWTRIIQRIYGIHKSSHEAMKKPEDIVSCNICSKCGKLAVNELCNEALGGSTVCQEYFVSGTQPTESCDCHVKYRICKKSGKLATENCPKSEIEERIYLKKEEWSETKDSPNIVPQEFSEESCDVHKS